MPQVLELIIRARDEFSGKIKGSMDSLKTSLPIIAGAASAYVGVVKASFDLAKGYMDYVIEVGDLAAKTGMGEAEAAAIIEMAKITGTDVTTWVTAFKRMADQDIPPTIEGLIEVKRKLDEAATPAERLGAAQALMGRTGSDLIPILDSLGKDGLVSLAEGMQNAVTPTHDEYLEMLKVRDTVGEFNSNFDTMKLQLGAALIDNTGVLDIVERWNEVLGGTLSYLQAVVDTVTGGGSGTPSGRVLPRVGGPVPGPRTGPIVELNPRRSGRAFGGEIGSGGDAYMVGEHGAETFTPGRPGTITPANDQLSREIRRMLRVLPVILKDAVERSK